MKPVYWMHEESGKMKEIVLKFINKEMLTNDELNTIKWYIHQWAFAMPSYPPDLHRLFDMNQIQLKKYNFDVLMMEYSIDAI